ncbi:hypothetical protein SAY87_030719 [Trapa incisa]|uniref:Uncharacterized protein n=1 Tax=Trapa incisa TaxID=236973 RepID=A0AAN7KNP3_9MYRT|nr:hypothetical protein SAY87_030719 [Trapa incisa]
MQPAVYHPSELNMPSPSTMISFGGTTASGLDPLVGMIGEMTLARLSNGSETGFHAYSSAYHLAGSSSPRLRRHMVQADESLSRICFFLFCCMFMCLLLF